MDIPGYLCPSFPDWSFVDTRLQTCCLEGDMEVFFHLVKCQSFSPAWIRYPLRAVGEPVQGREGYSPWKWKNGMWKMIGKKETGSDGLVMKFLWSTFKPSAEPHSHIMGNSTSRHSPVRSWSDWTYCALQSTMGIEVLCTL